jgi:hypothetical protein
MSFIAKEMLFLPAYGRGLRFKEPDRGRPEEHPCGNATSVLPS